MSAPCGSDAEVDASSDSVQHCATATTVVTDTLQPQATLRNACCSLQEALFAAQQQYCHHASGVVRLEVPIPQDISALQWLQGQTASNAHCHPLVYFSPRRSSAPDSPSAAAASVASSGAGAVAALGLAWHWQGPPGKAMTQEMTTEMNLFLSEAHPRVRIFGAARFDAEQSPSAEWASFGSYFFVLPRLEMLEAGNCHLLCCTLAWHSSLRHGPPHVSDAVADALDTLRELSPPALRSAPAFQVQRASMTHTPPQSEWQADMQSVHDSLAEPSSTLPEQLSDSNSHAALDEFSHNGQAGLDDLLDALDGGLEGSWHVDDEHEALAKAVLARRTDIQIDGRLNALDLLQALQERDPKAYQVYLQMADGSTFFGSTPERLYVRSGNCIASEAVAATRPRGNPGDTEGDFWLSLDLLRNPKDHHEFSLVRDWVRNALQGVCCSTVEVDVEKSVLRGMTVQHLYGRLSGTLHPDTDDAAILAALHPTPATCGRPRDKALALLQTSEGFDRGYFAGPFGWLSGCGAEFAVAIRSALLSPARLLMDPDSSMVHQQQTVSLYAGVGIVRGSQPMSEWQELDLKIQAINRFLQPVPNLLHSPSLNTLHTQLMVEELCRVGANTFCIAPGSRSTPLTAAIAQHPRAKLVPCLDERSLCFWAVGFAKATGRPAVVVTSSGTAVANLMPAVIEASQSNIPLILLTADRPGELRDTGANQTIDQVKLFCSYTRWTVDVSPPSPHVPARMTLTTVDTAVRWAMHQPSPGPVHINCQFREPLVPSTQDWPCSVLQGLQHWQASSLPFTSNHAAAATGDAGAALDSHLLALIAGAQRGLLVVGELASHADALAAGNTARTLGWPVATDVLSGLRVGSQAALPTQLHHLDHVLLERTHAWPAMQPDVVLQLGRRIVSKRLGQFLEWACLPSCDDRDAALWILVSDGPQRFDSGHVISHHVQLQLPELESSLSQAMASTLLRQDGSYTRLCLELDATASQALQAAMSGIEGVNEPQIARDISRLLPTGEALFLGNSMPIRDMDMYAAGPPASHAAALHPQGVVSVPVGVRVAANRGASGIDGVVSTAAGYAAGLGRSTTLVIGDVSFVHDSNGLGLLRSGEMAPPLTVVLVNNAGGGIFSMLPNTEQLPQQAFTQLWATPPQVDLAGLCQAHGIAHQKVTTQEQLAPALHNAWALNKPSVVEVVTNRHSNVEHHRGIQAAVRQAVAQAALQAAPTPDTSDA